MPPEPIHRAIVDVMMPSSLGTKLQKRLTAEGKNLPVIFMSGHPQDVLMRTVGLEPTARLLAKPFEAEQLGAAIADAFGEGPVEKQRAKVLVVDDNRDVGEVFQQLIELQNHDALLAYNGRDAVRMARSCPTRIVRHRAREGMNGYDVAREPRRPAPEVNALDCGDRLQSASSSAEAVQLASSKCSRSRSRSKS